MNRKTCCMTGHRDTAKEQITYVKHDLRLQVQAAIQNGYTRLISGFAQGVDLIFAVIVTEEKKVRPNLFLEAAIPYTGRLKTKDKNFHTLFESCNQMKIECEKYTPFYSLC